MDPLDYLEPIDITSKLPVDLEEQFVSKKWQDRKTALDLIHGILIENPKLADNPDYSPLIKQLTKILSSDANINCAAQAARCLTGFAKGLSTKFTPNVTSIAPVIFDKFKEKKATLKDPLIELIDSIFAISDLANLIPPIMEAAKKPNPSQKSQLDQFLYRAFRTIDPQEIPKGILKDLVTVLSEHAIDPDAEVRDSACAALGAIQKCIGEKALAMFLSNNLPSDPTKMAKITEYKEKAEDEAAKIRAENAKANNTRQQPEPSNQTASGIVNNTQQSIKAGLDIWDIVDPVDIISKLPKDLYQLFASKKWQDRKAALDLIHGLLMENPKLADNPDYSPLIKQLTKILDSDANINCAAQAARCLIGFAKGLRAKFAPNAVLVAPIVFEKFKEKKAILRDPLVELIDAVYATSNLKNLIPSIITAAKKPNPSQKSQLDQFLYRAFRTIDPQEIPKGILKDLVNVLSEHAFDPDAEVRDSACAALGAIQKCIGEKAFIKLACHKIIGDPLKMAKISESMLESKDETANGSVMQHSGKKQRIPQSPLLSRSQASANSSATIPHRSAHAENVRPATAPATIQTQQLPASATVAIQPEQTPTKKTHVQKTVPHRRPLTSSGAPMGNHPLQFEYANTPSGSRIPRILPSKFSLRK